MKVCDECKKEVKVLVSIDDVSEFEICETCLTKRLKRKDIVRCDDCKQYVVSEYSTEFEDEYGNKTYYCEGCAESHELPSFVDSQDEFEEYLETRNFDN
ncbi:hypothetical protein [Exiguobacterium sp. s7]|uniref:hypothetical protein n=1 Tax=Exiguobacterium sp. s7 TaxID=2751235 RepID=UPI001BE4F91A|nr:hypothetical protein [Exiguobacterium sp. s7]